MIRTSFLAVLYVTALVCLVSCGQKKKSQNDVPVAQLTVSPQGSVVFSSNAQRVTIGTEVTDPVFTVSTNQSDWSVASDREWLTATVDKDANKFTLSAKPNANISSIPTASVTVSVNDTLKIVIPVSQLSFGVENADAARVALVVGRGYDVTGNYANAAEIKAPVLDFFELYKNNLVKQHPDFKRGDGYTYSSNEITKVASKLSASAGVTTNAGLAGICSFQQEFETGFAKERIEQNSYAVSVTKFSIVRDAYKIEYTDPAKLQDYVTPGFLQDLETKSMDDIITLYGTHIMMGGLWGARMDQNISVRKRLNAYFDSTSSSFSINAEATFKGITAGGGVNTAYSSEYEKNYDVSTYQCVTKVYGGAPEYAISIHNHNDYTKWENSIANNEIWCDYYPNTLVPIYEFVANPTYKTALKTAYDNYFKGKVINVANVLKNDVLKKTVKAQGGGRRTGGGDDDINSQSGRTTSYFVKITLSEMPTEGSISADITLEIREDAKNYTKLEMNQTKEIYVGKKSFAMSAANGTGRVSWSTSGKISGQKHGWEPVSVSGCPFLSGLRLRIDGKGDDKEVMGVDADFSIKYSYLGTE